jgi:hypothetical protein
MPSANRQNRRRFNDSHAAVATYTRHPRVAAEYHVARMSAIRGQPRRRQPHCKATGRRQRVGAKRRLGGRHCERSEAIHSFFARRDGLLRGACHRARIRATHWLAMTISRHACNSRDAKRPSRCIYLPPKEGVGNAGCPLHPRPSVHLVMVERTRVTTSTPESPGIPARNGFTTYFVLSPVTGLFCHRHPRIWFCLRPVGPTKPPRT